MNVRVEMRMAVVFWLLLAAASTVCAAPDLLIEHVTIVSAERQNPLRGATVSIHDGQISKITAGAVPKATPGVEVIDGKGLYLTPGLIDSHVHLSEIPGMTEEQERAHPQIARDARAQIPRSYLYFGYTTLIDLNSSPQAMAPWKAQPLHPNTYFCGGASLMDGYPMHWTSKPRRYQLFPYFLIEPGMTAPPGIDPAEHTPAAVVKRLKADGAFCVKTFFEHGFGADHDLPVPRLETIRTLIHEAHAAGMAVLMHANASEAQQFALDAGVDIIAHGLWNWVDPDSVTEITPQVRQILDGVVAAHVGWQPTIEVLNGLQGLFDASFLADRELAEVVPSGLLEWYRTSEGKWFRDVMEQGMGFNTSVTRDARDRKVREIFSSAIARDQHAVAYLNAHGGHILFGTDTPSSPTYANQPGLNGWGEMHLLVTAGMTPAQVFRAATLSNAQALGLHDVGTVEVGRRANLLLLTEDPTRTVDAYNSIVKVILDGQVLDRTGLSARRTQTASANGVFPEH